MRRDSARSRWSPFRGADPALALLLAAANVLMLASAYVAHVHDASEGDTGEAVVRVEVDTASRGLNSLEVVEAYRTLASDSVFAGAHIGYVGTASYQAQAMHILRAEQNAQHIFRALANSARYPAGRVYGLLGLRLTDSLAYSKAHIDFAYDQTRMQTMFGCILRELSVADLVEMIDSGALVRDFTGDVLPGSTKANLVLKVY